MTVIEMSERQLTRLRVPNDLLDRQLTVEAAARLMCVGRRQVFGSRVALAAPSGNAVAGADAPIKHRGGRNS
jgi:hypothetical protein